MKFSTILAVFAVAMACALSGCRYDKARSGANGNGGDNATMTDLNSESGSLDDGLVSERPFEDYCTRCTDVAFAPVYFGFDSTVIPQGEITKIDAVIQHLKDKTDRVLVIEGNCDERGSNEYNMSLGENRAIIIRTYLTDNDIAADRIQTRSFGEEKPADSGHDEAAWAKNRRGEFAVYQK